MIRTLLTLIAVFVLAAAVGYCVIRPLDANPMAAGDAFEYILASAYHCGMLDAMQEKRGRGKACDEYKAIAKKKGVSVPP